MMPASKWERLLYFVNKNTIVGRWGLANRLYALAYRLDPLKSPRNGTVPPKKKSGPPPPPSKRPGNIVRVTNHG